MSKRDDIVLLQDIQECIDKITKYINGLNLSMFLSDEKTQDAVARNFEIIGEAAARMSEEFKIANPGVHWRILKDFRNKLIHVYEIIDYSIVWNAIQNELFLIYQQIKNILNNITGKEI